MTAFHQAVVDRFRRRTPLETGFAVSLSLHLAIFALFAWEGSVRVADGAVDPFEIDLSRPFRITDDPRLARRAENPGAGAPVVQKPSSMAGQGVVGGEEETPGEAKGPAKDWVLPTPQTTQVEAPTPGEAAGRPDGQGEGAGLGGLGGEGDGEVDWVYLTDLPRLLNRERLMRDMQRFYPQAQREADIEGWASLDVHVNAQGRVVRVTVVGSSDPAFEEPSRKVISQARFSPAKVKDRSVPVKIRQTIDFQLK